MPGNKKLSQIYAANPITTLEASDLVYISRGGDEDCAILATNLSQAGAGTVTSVGMTVPGILSVSGSPVTTSGTLALSLATQTANLVWAGPTTGSAATPTFRALVAADIPSLAGTYLTSVLTGKTLWIDSTNGDNGTATSGRQDKPYLTFAAAKTAAASGDLIAVHPGSFTVTDTIAKTGVGYQLPQGVTIARTNAGASDVDGIIDDLGSAVAATITGRSNLTHTIGGTTGRGGAITASHASTVMNLEVGNIYVNRTGGGSGDTHAIFHNAGTLTVRFNTITGAPGVDNTGGIWWENGQGYAVGQSIRDVYWGFYGAVSATPTGDYLLKVDYLEADFIPIVNQNSNADAASWIEATIIKSRTDRGGNGVAIVNDAQGKLYVLSEKIFGSTGISNGYAEITSPKVEAVINADDAGEVLFLSVSGGEARWNVQDHDPKSYAGPAFAMSGGTTIIRGAEFTADLAGQSGFVITDGTVILIDCLIDCRNSDESAIRISGGTLELYNCQVLGPGTGYDIEETDAGTVTVSGGRGTGTSGAFRTSGDGISITVLTGITAPSLGGTGIANSDLATLTRSGNHPLTITTVGTTTLSLPSSGTFTAVSTDGVQTFSNKSSSTNLTFTGSGQGLALHGGGTVTGAIGAITLAASGTNQAITLTPSGTGAINLGPNANFNTAGTLTCFGLSPASDLKMAASLAVYWTGRSLINSAADGVLKLSNNGQTDFGRLQFGGTTSSFPALKRSGTTIAGRLADDSADCSSTWANLTASGTLAVTGASTLTGRLTSNGSLVSVPQALNGSGALTAINVVTLATTIITLGAATTTLGAGTDGQIKIISMITDGGDCVVTVTGLYTGSTITFNDVGDSIMLQYVGGMWIVLANNGCILA